MDLADLVLVLVFVVLPLLQQLLERATKKVFDERIPLEGMASVIESFEKGWKVEVSQAMQAAEYLAGLDQIAGLEQAASRLAGGGSAPRLASAIEFVLEGLHLSNRLNKVEEERRVRYARR